MPVRQSDLRRIIAGFFNVAEHDISPFTDLKGGSNHVYSFCIHNDKYVIRKPGYTYEFEKERAAYEAIKHLDVSDEVLYFDDNGIKIARFVEGNPLGYSSKDRADAVALLRRIHQSGAAISGKYDIFEKITSYCRNAPKSKRKDKLLGYAEPINAIRARLEAFAVPEALCHGDACVTTNYLRLKDGSVRLIDWEQTGMADPFLDFAIAALNQDVEKVDPVRCAEEYAQHRPLTGSETYRINAYLFLVAVMWAGDQIKDADGFEDYRTYADEALARLTV